MEGTFSVTCYSALTSVYYEVLHVDGGLSKTVGHFDCACCKNVALVGRIPTHGVAS